MEVDSELLVASPRVSVLVITWNHGPYLAQCLDSLLAQRCDFPFEILIGEDHSQDDTPSICESYRDRHQDQIRVISSAANVGMHHNLARIWHRARGAYIAICEGDDYWVDPTKLATQVAQFEADAQLTLCGGYTRQIALGADGVWREAGRIEPKFVQDQYSMEDLIAAYSFHTSSVMVRKDRIAFPRWFWDVYCADRPLYLLCAAAGTVRVIPETLSVYRMHDTGIWSPRGLLDKAAKGRELFDKLDEYFDHRYTRLMRKTVGGMYWGYMQDAINTGQTKVGRQLVWITLELLGTPLIFVHTRAWLVALARLYIPRTYARLRRLLPGARAT